MVTSLIELKEKIDQIPRIKLAHLPTPLEDMARLTKALNGPHLWIKRDDCTGLAFGGNKERKTEYVMADALSKKADVVITTGGIQSNHVRATSSAARKCGLKAILVLTGKEPKTYDGNLLLDHLLGSEIRFFKGTQKDWEKTHPMEKIAKELAKQGHTPYIIPAGASYPIGAIAYMNALLELLNQARDTNLKIDYIVHAAGSGGTQAGLILAKQILKSSTAILGINVEPGNNWLIKKTVDIANATASLLRIKETVKPKDVMLRNYSKPGYGVLSSEAKKAIELTAKTEGILLDPMYTGKAMAGVIDMTRQNQFKKSDNIVFIHTGGTPTLFPYKSDLT